MIYWIRNKCSVKSVVLFSADSGWLNHWHKKLHKHGGENRVGVHRENDHTQHHIRIVEHSRQLKSPVQNSVASVCTGCQKGQWACSVDSFFFFPTCLNMCVTCNYHSVFNYIVTKKKKRMKKFTFMYKFQCFCNIWEVMFIFFENCMPVPFVVMVTKGQTWGKTCSQFSTRSTVMQFSKKITKNKRIHSITSIDICLICPWVVSIYVFCRQLIWSWKLRTSFSRSLPETWVARWKPPTATRTSWRSSLPCLRFVFSFLCRLLIG